MERTTHRIEHHAPDGTMVVLYHGVVLLPPLARELEAEGERGELRLVDDRSGAVRVRVRLGQTPHPATTD